jgi:hypothetical protein
MRTAFSRLSTSAATSRLMPISSTAATAVTQQRRSIWGGACTVDVRNFGPWTDAPKDAAYTEHMYYVYRENPITGNSNRLEEVFLNQYEAEQFAQEKSRHSPVKINYFTEDHLVERHVVKSSANKPARINYGVNHLNSGALYELHDLESWSSFSQPSPHANGVSIGELPAKDASTRTLYELWRVDGQGNAARMEPVHEDRSKAEAVMAELQSTGQKQDFYIECVQVNDK